MKQLMEENKSNPNQFWIFNATHIGNKKLTEEELSKIGKTKKEFYKNLEEGNLVK